MTKLLTFTIYYFAFLCKPIWGTLVYHSIIVIYYRSPCPDIFLGTASPKIFRETVFPHVSRSPSTTPLATAVIFQSINYNISAMPT